MKTRYSVAVVSVDESDTDIGVLSSHYIVAALTEEQAVAEVVGMALAKGRDPIIVQSLAIPEVA